MRCEFAGITGKAIVLLSEDGDYIGNYINRRMFYYEADLLAKIASYTDRPGVFVDVGAHIGNHTVCFSADLGRKTISVEPRADTVAYLNENIRANNVGELVVVHTCAISDIHTSVDLVLPASTAPSASLNTGGCRVVAGSSVPAVTLDSLLPDENVALMKIDVEGHAASVLRSALGTIRRCFPVIAVECWSEEEKEECLAAVAGFNYRWLGPFCLTPTWVLEPIIE